MTNTMSCILYCTNLGTPISSVTLQQQFWMAYYFFQIPQAIFQLFIINVIEPYGVP